MTIGKKLLIGSASMLGVTVLLSISSLYTTETLGNELSKTASVTGRKLELAGAMASDAANMLSAERGLLLRLALGDQTKATGLHQAFASSADGVRQDIRQIETLVSSAEDRTATNNLKAAFTAWMPADEAMWQLCSKQDYQGAFKVFDEKVSPQANQVQSAANEIVALEHKSLEQEKTRASELPIQSRWMAIGLAILSVVAGVLVIWVVQGVTGTLRHIATNMAETAEEVIRTSQQISSFSEQLAAGASDQAASLEETSASSAEISSMTQSNAGNARAATEIVTRVDEQVQQANRSLEQMIASMQNIKDSSKKIAQIITVIEQIAFQTNILALNAAVEAARAGEAGLGFAVVADEVRSLAQRCSEAARDTGALINAAVSSSNEGSSRLNGVVSVISEITGSAAKVRQMVSAVNEASQDQARGISQIADGLSRMEKVTQQTAASAEQGTKASRQMDTQAHALQQVVHELLTMVDERAA
ncbi:MAG TPA: methyl-accepting chemotaxis protein [Bryobacteraceae bacterium]|nr:methyl-accepting chemotaxis protein [Bryobacteraceae bacterium]